MPATDHCAVSFAVPAYNSEATLAEAVLSIVHGNFHDGDELLIVDDASTDGTPKLIQGLAAKFPAIKTLRHRYRKGSAAAGRNTAIEHSSHDLIFALDADNVLVEGSVDRLKERLKECQADAATFQEIRYFTRTFDDVELKWVFPAGEITLADALCSHLWPGPSGNYLFTKESWIRAGRYHEFIGGGIDSWAFAIRQLATGSKMVVTPESHYFHRYGGETAHVRDVREGGIPRKALQVLLPFLDSLNDDDVDYIMGKEGRLTWFDNLQERPLRLKSGLVGSHGESINPPPPPLVKRIIRRLKMMAELRFI